MSAGLGEVWVQGWLVDREQGWVQDWVLDVSRTGCWM